MAVYKRTYRRYEGSLTAEWKRFLVPTRFAFEELYQSRILALLHEKIRMFELVVGEIGSILGNLEGGEEFESLVLALWLKSRDARELRDSFDSLGNSLLAAQEEYLQTKRLDEALFGDDYE